jgi:hypothetical protein
VSGDSVPEIVARTGEDTGYAPLLATLVFETIAERGRRFRPGNIEKHTRMLNVYRHFATIDCRDLVVPDLTLTPFVYEPRRIPGTSKEFTDGIVPEEVRAGCASRICNRGAHGAHGRRRVCHRPAILDL